MEACLASGSVRHQSLPGLPVPDGERAAASSGARNADRWLRNLEPELLQPALAATGSHACVTGISAVPDCIRVQHPVPCINVT